MKSIIVFVFFILFHSFSFSQNNVDRLNELKKTYKPFVTDFHWVIFKTTDSVYKLTQFTDPQGNYFFSFGFVDSSFVGDSSVFFPLSKSKRNDGFILTFRYMNNIDTVFSYNNNKQYKAEPFIEEAKGVINFSSEIIDDLKFSSIYKKLGLLKAVKDEDITLRVLLPTTKKKYDTPSPSRVLPYLKPGFIYAVDYEKDYDCYEIKFLGNSAIMYKLIGKSIDEKGLQLIKSDSAFLKLKDIENIKNKLKQIENTNLKCRTPGSPWLMEYWVGDQYFQYIMSDDCLHEKRKLMESASIVYLVIGLSGKYFRQN